MNGTALAIPAWRLSPKFRLRAHLLDDTPIWAFPDLGWFLTPVFYCEYHTGDVAPPYGFASAEVYDSKHKLEHWLKELRFADLSGFPELRMSPPEPMKDLPRWIRWLSIVEAGDALEDWAIDATFVEACLRITGAPKEWRWRWIPGKSIGVREWPFLAVLTSEDGLGHAVVLPRRRKYQANARAA